MTVALDRPAALTGTVTLAKRDARRYGLGRRALTLDRDRAESGSADRLLESKPKKRVARNLRRARKLRLTLALEARDATGAVSRTMSTISLTR